MWFGTFASWVGIGEEHGADSAIISIFRGTVDSYCAPCDWIAIPGEQFAVGISRDEGYTMYSCFVLTSK